MNTSRIFILRPVATSLLMVAVILVGVVSFRQLSISALPEVDYPTIQIQTFYPGASPDVMADAVTAPLEKQFGQIPGLIRMTSNSSFGSSIIALQFDLSINIDVAEQEVQAAINAANSYLPADLPNPPIYNKVNPADMPVLTLALTSQTLPLTEVEKMAETRLAMKISQLPGVGLVSISGGQRPAVRIQANPVALASYGMSLESLRTALSQANVDMAKGNFDGPDQDWTIEDNDSFTAQDYSPIIVAYNNGAPIRLKDVATVIDGAENNKEAAWFNETPAILLNIQRQPSANIIDLVNRIQKTLPQLKTSLPSGIDVQSVSDSTIMIRASVGDVEFELLLAVVLVILVIYLFLRSAAASAIPGVAVPLSIIGTFGVMYLFNYSLDNLSLMALTISTGFVVDDAIVMVENIERYIEAGDPPLQAALKGAGEIGFTIVSLTISLIAVLIPLLFMGDIVGRLFKEFAVTLAVTIIISALVSLSSTPMMAAKILRRRKEGEKQNAVLDFFEKTYNKSFEIYERYLNIVLIHHKETVLVFLATLVLTGLLFWFVPKGFLPTQDTGALLGISEAPQTISFDEMARRQQNLVSVILKDPAVQNLTSFIGIDGTNITENSGRIQINLKPLGSRPAASDVIRRLNKELGVVPGITLYLQPVQELTVADQVSRTQYQYTIEGPDPKVVDLWANKLFALFKTLPNLEDVATDQQNNGLSLALHIDRDTASRFGILPQTIDNILYDAFGQRQVSTIFTASNQYHVILESLAQWQQNIDGLNRIYIPTSSAPPAPPSGMSMGNSQAASSGGSPTPLRTITSVQEVPVPLVINHQGQFPVVTLSFNLAPRASLGAAVSEINRAVKNAGLPQSLSAGFTGTAQSFEASLSNEWILILAAIVTVYIVLGVLYESYIHPLTIISSLPSAGVGALAALIICGQDFDIISLIGIILLIGIVKKNAIMMIDFALEAERVEKKSPRDAIYQACLLRFRPIMMTTMAALLGAVPLALGSGMGAELRRPLGISIIGGLLISQPMTLLTTPVIYLQFDKLKNWIMERRRIPNVTPAIRKPGSSLNEGLDSGFRRNDGDEATA